MTIRAVLFDAAGTLIHLPRGVGWHYREITRRHGLEIEETTLARAFGTVFKAALPRVSSGISRPDDDKGWWRNVVRQVLAACGHEPPDPEFSAIFEEMYAHFAEPGVWALYPEAESVLKTLHGHYKLAVVSNFDRRLYHVFDHLNIRQYFETIVLSSELGADKPDPRMFTEALTRLNVTPAEAVHAGDDPSHDWQAAEAAGLHVYRVERPQQGLEALPDFVHSLR